MQFLFSVKKGEKKNLNTLRLKVNRVWCFGKFASPVTNIHQLALKSVHSCGVGPFHNSRPCLAIQKREMEKWKKNKYAENYDHHPALRRPKPCQTRPSTKDTPQPSLALNRAAARTWLLN
ncbi:hypothetical protein T07_9996 [Trichinella nelsoni]|uniref:Uncharacterized protein n=1 Tax=Trichinella nelsoni TaxID=6336 RepID=A0A0V0RV49_9BILA|nr:hypothetical protein T07_9996 [Trichinella nelsoni]